MKPKTALDFKFPEWKTPLSAKSFTLKEKPAMTQYQVAEMGSNIPAKTFPNFGEAKIYAHLTYQAAEIRHNGQIIYDFNFTNLESLDVIIVPASDFHDINYHRDPNNRREERNTGTTGDSEEDR